MSRINFLAAAVVVLGAHAARAEMPMMASDQTQAMRIVQRGGMFAGSNWWNRYGEPVNAVALASADHGPVDKGGAVPLHGDGYVYGPGTCDCSPPCIWDLWAGYSMNPLRCRAGMHGCRSGHCRSCCGTVAKNCGVTCGSATPSCGAPVSCGAPISCGTAVSDCGCKPVCGKCRHFHLGERWRGFTAHWHCGCGTAIGCGAAVDCGCATPVAPMMSEKQASQGPPVPLPEDAALLRLPRLN